MRTFIKTALIGLCICCGNATLASPAEDAALIAERTFDDAMTPVVAAILKQFQVSNYGRQLEAQGIIIIDEAQFAEFLPPSDPSSMIENLRAKLASDYAKVLTPEQMAQIAQTMRLLPDVTLDDILSDTYRSKLEKTFADALAAADIDESDDQHITEIKIITAQLSVMNAALSDDAVKDHLVLSMVPLFSFLPLLLQPPAPDLPLADPGVIQALKTQGVVRAPNRIVLKDLIAELEASLSQQAAAPQTSEQPQPVRTLFTRAPSRP